jgi:diaminopimelate decarboxylase
MEEFQFRQNELWCEQVNLNHLAAECGTPLYVYSKRSIVDHCRHVERAFGTIDHLSCYAVKANANIAVLRLLAGEGIGADAGSIGEMRIAIEAGFSPEKITFSGVGKRDDEIEYALKNGIMALNVESAEEIDVIDAIASRLKSRAKIFLRLNFDIESGTHPYITTGRKQNKFGIELDSAAEALRRARSFSNVEVIGIHTHLGSQITRVDAFIAAATAMVKVIRELRADGMPISQLNFGGGFGVQYRDYITHPGLPAEIEHSESGVTTVKMLQAVLPVLAGANCRILIQPGRSIVAHAGILMTKVLYIKDTKSKRFVIVDAGMNDLIRPSLYQSYHQIVPLCLKGRPHGVVDIVGPLCESGDFFALDRMLPAVERSEYLGVLCTGAYGYVLSSNYNGRPRPAEMLVDGDQFGVIRKPETISDLY